LTSSSRPLAAALWMMASVVGFTLIAIAARELGGALDSFEMMLYRSAIGFAVVCAGVLLLGRGHEIATDRLPLHGARNLVHFAGQNLWLVAIGMIPLAQVFALEFTTPLIVALLAPLLLGERLGATRLLTALTGFAGVLVVARPFGEVGLTAGVLVALGSALGFAGAALFTKVLTRTSSVANILFWLTLMQTLFSLVAAGWDGDIVLPPASGLPWVLVLGLAGLLAHIGLTNALSLAPASVVTPLDFVRLPVIALIGAALYAEPFDPLVLLGGAVIVLANWINIKSELRVPTATG
jgi:drug/metabolite transporter (DMT)-like permease